MIRQGDFLLIPFPFSDQSGRKIRPVIVISNDEFNNYSGDVIVVGVTSNISKDRYTLQLNNTDFEEGKLLTQCCIKVENILRIDKELVLRKIGKIKREKLKIIISRLIEIISG